MLKRVAEARRNSDRRQRQGVLVKRPKPGQDLRVDLPAIGPNTVRNADAAGLAGIAVMAGHVLAAERLEMIEIADQCGLFIAGIETTQRPQSSRAALGSAKPVGLGSVRIGDRAGAEIGRAIGILSELAAFGSGSALVVRRRSRHRHRSRGTAARRHRTSRRTSQKACAPRRRRRDRSGARDRRSHSRRRKRHQTRRRRQGRWFVRSRKIGRMSSDWRTSLDYSSP